MILATADLKVHYKGAALDDNRMSVEDLAPSLLALSDVLKEIQKIYNPDEKPLSLDIRATEKGSFIVDLAISVPHEIINMLSGAKATAGANLLAYIEAFGTLVNLIIAHKKSKISSNKRLKSGDIKLKFEDGTTLTVPEETLRAYKNIDVRRSVSKVVEPARKNGIDEVEFSSQHVNVTVSKQEVAAFQPPVIPEESFEPVISTEYLQLVNVSFQKGSKWKFSDGNTQFYAAIEDDSFVQSVLSNMDQFGATDSLKVRMRKTQSMTDSGLKGEVVIEKVIEHIPGSRQLELDLGEKKNTDK